MKSCASPSFLQKGTSAKQDDRLDLPRLDFLVTTWQQKRPAGGGTGVTAKIKEIARQAFQSRETSQEAWCSYPRGQ
jgi:hypothetical protein